MVGAQSVIDFDVSVVVGVVCRVVVVAGVVIIMVVGVHNDYHSVIHWVTDVKYILSFIYL